MALLIAVVGLSGAGKTTAVDHLKYIASGEKVYLGNMVLNEVLARGLSPSPENERLVRLDLRSRHGAGALAVRAVPTIKKLLNDGIDVFVDAIFTAEEYQHLQRCSGNSSFALLAIQASFEIRANRLASRTERPRRYRGCTIRDGSNY